MYYSNDMQAYRSNGNGSYSGAGETLYDYNPAGVGSENSDLVQCEYCGEYFSPGNDYRNHVMAAHSGAASGDGENELIQCEYCGEYFSAGNDYRNHILAAHPEVAYGDGEDE